MYFTNEAMLKKAIELKVNNAVKNTVEEMHELLKQSIKENFYDEYSPKRYNRTFKLLNSAAYKMIGQGVGTVYMDESYDGGRYINGKSLSEVQEDAAYGIHGGDTSPVIQTDGQYWEEFIKLIDENGLDILEKNLRLQGFEVTRHVNYLFEAGLEF